MSEQPVFVSEELQKKAKLIFGLLGVGCIGILVYGVIVGEGSKNWRGDLAAEEQARQAAFQARQDATQRVQVKPTPAAPSQTSPGAVRKQQQTPSGDVSPYQPLATTPPAQGNQASMMMFILAEKIQRSLQMYFQEHRTYQGFVVTDRDSTGCVSAVAYSTPDGSSVSVVLTGGCNEKPGRSYGCIDVMSQSLIALSEEEYLSSASEHGYCVGGHEVTFPSSGVSDKDIPEGQSGVSGGFVSGE